jgi:exonuclease VII large subunit
MTSKAPTPKPILRPKPQHQEIATMTQLDSIQGQLDQLEQLRQELTEREKALEERARVLAQRLEQVLSQKTKELDEQEEALNRLEQSLEEEQTNKDAATPSFISNSPTPTSIPTPAATTSSVTQRATNDKPKNDDLFALESPTPNLETMLPVSTSFFTLATLLPFSPNVSVPTIAPTPSKLPSLPLSNALYATTSQQSYVPAPSIAHPPTTPTSTPASSQTPNLSFRKAPLAWIAQHKGAIGGVIVSGLVGFSTAYASRALVANEVAKQTTALQKEAISLQAASLDPFRTLRDKVLEQDPCRSGHAYLLISNNYKAFAQQAPSHQLKILALDPKIRNNINLIARGKAPRSGSCNLFR